MSNRWESVPYAIVSVRPTIDVYRIKDSQTEKEKVVHRNLWLPIDFLNLDEDEILSSLMEIKLGVAANESGQGSVAVGDIDRNAQTMDG